MGILTESLRLSLKGYSDECIHSAVEELRLDGVSSLIGKVKVKDECFHSAVKEMCLDGVRG